MAAVFSDCAFCAALAFVAALALSGCAPLPKEAAAPAYPYSGDHPAVFVFGAAGLLPVAPGLGADTHIASYRPAPGALALRAAALAAASPEAGEADRPAAIAVAVNRWGLLRLEREPQELRGVTAPAGAQAAAPTARGAYRIKALERPDLFGALSVGGLWSRPEGFLLHLYRDPFVADPEPARPDVAGLFLVSGAGAFEALPRSAPQGGTSLAAKDAGGAVVAAEAAAKAASAPAAGAPGSTAPDPRVRGLFALFPVAADRWLAEYRRETTTRVDTSYFLLRDPTEEPRPGKALASIGRVAFEKALRPRPLTEAPRALASAVAALGSEAFLVHARGEDGVEGYWLSGGRPEEALEVSAWLGREGSALVLAGDGRAALAEAGEGGAASAARAFTLVPPAPGAAFGQTAALFGAASSGGGLAVAAWERGSFPEVELAGLLVFPLP